jgi:dUTP pyrophosphatase
MSGAAMLIKRLRPEAILPVRGSSLAAGFDLASSEEVMVPKGGKAIVKTGLSMAIPAGTYARLAPRSGLAAKHMIDVGAGVVDSDYRGEVGVVLFNHGAEDFAVKVGDRIAQLVVEKFNTCGAEEVDSLEETARGAGGFGSTGVAAEKSVGVAERPDKKPRTDEPRMLVKKLRPEAVVPVKGSVEAAGFDLSASESITVPAGGKAIAKTGLSVAVPEGTYARIAPRSGLAAKHMLHCGAGVVDYDYRGEVGVVLFNYGTTDFTVAAGDRVAQMILEEVDMAGCIEVESLDGTARGSGGFGSTGVSQATITSNPASANVMDTSTDAPGLVRVKKLVAEASMPVRGSQYAAGFDLAAAHQVSVPARGKAIVKTGLSIAIPEGTYARVAPRSGLAAKRMIHVGAGVVDADYRGEVGVVVFNHGTEDFEVAQGDRVAQLILEKIAMLQCEEVESLDTTARGAGGFGSTGVAAKVVEEKAANKGYDAGEKPSEAPVAAGA